MTFKAGITFALGAAILGLSPLLAESIEIDESMLDAVVEWHERTVDLYVDAQLRHDASVLRTDDGNTWAILLPDSQEAWLLTPGAEGTESEDVGRGVVQRVSASTFTWTEPLKATLPAIITRVPGEPIGSWTEVEGGWVAKTADRAFLALPHQGAAGALDTDELWRTVPSWKRLQDAWRPEAEGEAEAMEVLRALADSGLTFEAVLGTWCGDSRRSVPKLLAAADELGLDVSLVALRRGFSEPLHYARDHRVTNVPTILVKRGDLEIGRFVERPRSASVITDLAAIVQRRPLPPPESFSDDDVLLARGEYVLRSAAGADVGRETWSIFRTEEGHARLGSRRVGESGEVTEVWQRWAPAEDGGRTGFVEVTRDARGERSRTRLSRRSGARDDIGKNVDSGVGNDAVHSLTRGDAGGIVEQDLSVPATTVVVSPGIAASGLAWQAAGRPESATLTVLVVPGAGDGFAARQDAAELTHIARVELYDPSLGDVATDHVVLRRGGARPATYEWWIHTELGVPVRAQVGGVVAELVWLEVEASSPPWPPLHSGEGEGRPGSL